MSNMSKQVIKGGDGSKNFQAGGNMYVNFMDKEERDFGIIDEIFKNVIEKIKNEKIEVEKGFIDVNKKIELNFPDEDDKQLVKDYFLGALEKVCLIDKRIKEEDSIIQKALHSHILGRYRELKKTKDKNIDIMEELFKQFIIPGKEDDCLYTNIARAFVLFFFEDCTIFEKTKGEKSI